MSALVERVEERCCWANAIPQTIKKHKQAEPDVLSMSRPYIGQGSPIYLLRYGADSAFTVGEKSPFHQQLPTRGTPPK